MVVVQPGVFAGDGEMADLMRARDWAATPLGPADGWPPGLLTAVNLILESRSPMMVIWGPEFIQFYNDAFRPILGSSRHPGALGAPCPHSWPETWATIGPLFQSVRETGRPVWCDDLLLEIDRDGYREETHFAFSYSPIRDETGGVGGVLVTSVETTAQVLSERRLRTLRDLAARTSNDRAAEACAAAAAVLADNPADLPFALIYLLDAQRTQARLAGVAGLSDAQAGPVIVNLSDGADQDDGWPLRHALDTGEAVAVADLVARFGPLPGGPWPESPRVAVVLPLRQPGQPPLGLLVAGVSPRRALDDAYRGFLDLVADQVASAIANARTLDSTGRRAVEDELRRRAGLLDQAEDAVFAWTIDGTIVYWNKGAERLYGYAVDEAIGRISHELLRTEHPGGRDAFLRALQTDETIEAELTQTRREGARVTVATRHQMIREGNRELVLEANRDITERKAIEAALRESEERQAFLLKLSDALRPLSDPAEIQSAANRLVGERLQADRSYYVEIANARGLAIVGRDDVRGDAPSLADSHPLASFTAVLDSMRNGRPFVAVDAMIDPRISDADRVAYTARALRSFVAIPLIKAGQLAAALCVTSARPREWTVGDVALLQEVTERTWEAVERARAEQALRESEARLSQELADTRQLQAISSQLIQEDDIDLLYAQIVDAATALMRSDMGSMQMFDPERNELVLLAHNGFAPESAAFWRHVRVDSSTSCGAALATGERVVVPDVETCAFMADTDDLHFYRASAIRAVQSMPLLARDGRVVGMISNHWRDVHEPTERALRLLDVLARQAADLIERRRADEAMRASERRWQQLADAMPQIVWISAADGATITYLNRRWFDYTGQSSGDVGGRSSVDVATAIHPDDRPRTMERWSGSVAAGTEFEAAARLRGADGDYRWFLSRCVPIRDDAGQTTQWFGTSTDITALKQAEAAVRRSEERLQRAIEIETVGVIYFRTDGAVTYANDAFLRMSGYDRDDVARGLVRWDIMTPPEWMEESLRAIDEFLSLGRTTPYEKEYIRKDGTRWWALFAGTRLDDDEGVEFVLDITESKRMEAAHQAIIDAVAHDVKNPLTAVVGQAQLISRRLARGVDDFDRLKAGVAAIEAGATRAADLLDDLTDAARLDAGQLLTLQSSPVDLVSLAETAARQHQSATGRHTIQVETTVASLVGDWDAARIRRVLDNLLGNAVKYSPNGGPVTVTIGREEESGDVWAVLTVADQGVGIPRRDLPRVFERFHRGGNVARRIAGSGIGLSGARQIVEQHGGTIAVASVEAQGSAFTVRLPLPADAG